MPYHFPAFDGTVPIPTTFADLVTFEAGLIVNNDQNINIGTTNSSASPAIRYDTTQTVDTGMLLTGTVSNAWVIAERQDETFDFAHAQATNPTLFIHSAAQSTTQWVGLTHDGTDAVISTGTGNLNLTSASLAVKTQAIILQPDYPLWIGSVADTQNIIAQFTVGTPDQTLLGTGTTSNAWIIAETQDRVFDFAHAAATDPTLFIHSHNQSTTEWVSLKHDGSNAVVSMGAGSFTSAGGITFAGNFGGPSFGHNTAGTGGGFWQPSVAAQTPDAAMLLTGSLSNSIIIAENGDNAFDFAHAQATNPTLFIHSAAQSTTQWASLAHNGTYAQLATGAGDLLLTANSGIVHMSGDAFFSLGGSIGSVATQGGFIYSSTQTPDSLILGTGTASNAMIIAEVGDYGFDFAHAQATNPTLFIHSAAQSTTQWLGLTHNGTNAVLSTGTGLVSLSSGTLFSAKAYNDIDYGGIFVGSTGGTTDNLIVRTSVSTPDANFLAVGTVGRAWIIADTGDVDFDFAHAAATNPTLFIHSANQSTTEYMSLAHNGTLGVINAPGGLSLPTTATITTIINTSQIVMNNDTAITFTSSQDATGTRIWSNRTTQTPDTTIFGLGTNSRHLLFVEGGDEAFDFAHAQATNPTLFIHSAAQSTTQWLGLTHNGTNANISTGAGVIEFLNAIQVNVGAITFSTSNASAQIGVRSTGQYTFSATTDASAAADTGLARNAAAVIRSTDGSTGITGFMGGGAAVASAAAMPVPTGRVFHVTGTTNITSITSTNFASGTVITLIFDDVLTFTDGNNLALAGNFVTSAGDTITLAFDGTNWYECSRSAN